MPTANLSFKLPEEMEEFRAANNGMDWKLAMQELDEYLRKQIKYSATVNEGLQQARRMLHEILTDRGLEL